MADGPTRIHCKRASDAADTGYAPRQPTAPKSPTSRSVGAAHGSGSTPMPGPLQVQHLPLQTNPSGLRGHRAVRSTLKTVQLSPSQQAFVDSLQGRLRREQAAERQRAEGTGEAGDTALSPAPCIGGLSTEGERQAPVKLPNAERGLSAVHAEDRGDTAPTSEKRKVQPPEPTRKMLRAETERRDLIRAAGVELCCSCIVLVARTTSPGVLISIGL